MPLAEKKGEIEAAFGGPLEWQRFGQREGCRIRAVSDFGGYRDPDEWPKIYKVDD